LNIDISWTDLLSEDLNVKTRNSGFVLNVAGDGGDTTNKNLSPTSSHAFMRAHTRVLDSSLLLLASPRGGDDNTSSHGSATETNKKKKAVLIKGASSNKFTSFNVAVTNPPN